MSYTKEPWPEYIDVAVVMTPDPNGPDAAVMSFEDYKRARACVNACVGIITADLERVEKNLTPIFDLLMQTTKQRDDLLAAMKSARLSLQTANDGHDEIITDTIWHTNHETLFDFMDAAIANAEQKP